MSTKLVRVLLVGESAKGSPSLQDRLEKRGCECHAAASCSEAAVLSTNHAFDLVLCTGQMERINELVESLIGSPTTLFRCQPVADSCWWLPVVRHGEKCLGVPALRPAEFACILDQITEDIKSGKRQAKVTDPSNKPNPRYTGGAALIGGSPMKLLSALSHKLLPLLLTLTLVHSLPAGSGKGTIRGAIATAGLDDLPVYLPGAQVSLRCEKSADKLNTTVTDENGRFSLPDLPTDKCSVTASAEGFRSQTKVVTVPENSVVDLSFLLQLLTIAERRNRI
jgi:carboxypeptidase family protein